MLIAIIIAIISKEELLGERLVRLFARLIRLLVMLVLRSSKIIRLD